jgi:hypothetical protein
LHRLAVPELFDGRQALAPVLALEGFAQAGQKAVEAQGWLDVGGYRRGVATKPGRSFFGGVIGQPEILLFNPEQMRKPGIMRVF